MKKTVSSPGDRGPESLSHFSHDLCSSQQFILFPHKVTALRSYYSPGRVMKYSRLVFITFNNLEVIISREEFLINHWYLYTVRV